MFSFIKKTILNSKQNLIKRRYPAVNIVLHPDMPLSSINKMVELASIVDAVNKLEPKIRVLSDEELSRKTEEFSQHILSKCNQHQSEIRELEELLLSVAIPEEKEKIRQRLKLARNKIFSDILVEAFAVVREVARRTVGMRHFDVQIAGGVVLHEGRIAEMATGEGKTLVATLPAYLNALLRRGVHIVTVNDYLARRDAEWMGPIYEFLGLTVGVIQHDLDDEARKKAYACDITYGTNNEFGFDYLRDNMKYSYDDLVQRPFFYAIVDEVDSILIDEARTPLIISGPAEESTEKYYVVDKIIPRLKGRIILERDEIVAKYKGEDLSRGYDYIVDEKAHTAYLTEQGETKVCSMLNVDNLHDIQTIDWRHHVIAALRAHNLFKLDVDYVVKEGQVIIVDEFTGRLMPGRRWSDGLHQAIEAKEGLRIERENQTLATITFQNYFRMYEKLAGMTGTAFSEAQEFKTIYQLDVVVLPTNRPLIRTNYSDCVYKTEEEKFEAVVKEISRLHKQGRPVLVGTTSVEKNLKFSELLKKRDIPYVLLNAKDHAQEAKVIAEAGRKGKVTVATNMAGRGIDIVLGGDPKKLKKAVLSTIICHDSLKYISELMGELKPLGTKFEEFKRIILEIEALSKKVYQYCIKEDASRVNNLLVNFDRDYSSFYNTIYNYISGLKEAIMREQKYLKEIFSIIGIDSEDSEGIGKLLEDCKLKLNDIESSFSNTKNNIDEFMASLRGQRQAVEDDTRLIFKQEQDIQNEIEVISKLKREEQGQGAEKIENKAIAVEELNKLDIILDGFEEKLDKIEQISEADKGVFLNNLSGYSKEFKELETRIINAGKEYFDSKKMTLRKIREQLLDRWRAVAYYNKLGDVKQRIGVLEGIIRNQLKEKIAPLIKYAEFRILEDIRRFQSEFSQIQENLQEVNRLSRDKVVSRDLSSIKDISALSPESRAKIGILSEDLGVYAREHDEVVGLGGLHVIGTERHEARRIDNQLRGRSGRQGDPGSSCFYVSLGDDLMRLFGSERMIGFMDRLGLEDGQVIEHPWVSKSIEMAQRRVEEHNFEIRKQLLEYDNVMNKQREVIYAQRRQILEGESLSEQILDMMQAVIQGYCNNYISKENQEAYDLTGLANALYLKFGIKINGQDLSGLSPDKIQERIYDILSKAYMQKQEEIGTRLMQHFQRMVLLQVIDSKWKDHLYAMDDLREGIGLRAIGQRDPLIEYKREAFIMFDQMIAAIQEDAVEMLFKIQPAAQERVQGVFRQAAQEFLHPEISRFRRPKGQTPDELSPDSDLHTPASRPSSTKTYPKVGRNDPCPCGAIDPRTGKPIKYKRCHGR